MVRGFASIGLAAWLTGCTASPGTLLAPLSYESLEPSSITSVDYEIPSRRPNHPASLEGFSARLDRYLDKVFTTAEPGIGLSPLHLVVSLSVRERRDVTSALRVFACFATAMLIPYQQHYVFTLRAERSWNGRHTRSYEYHEEMKLLQGLLLIPAGLSGRQSPQSASTQVMDKMLAHFVSDLRADLEARR